MSRREALSFPPAAVAGQADEAVAGPYGASQLGASQAALIVVNPSGNRARVALHPLPFTIGRQGDCDLVLRDNRASRAHARISETEGVYFVEDLKSRHGVVVNGAVIRSPWKLCNGDVIEFGISDSYKVIFTVEEAEIHRLMDQLGATGTHAVGTTSLGKLRALVEVARTVQNALSTESVLGAVVDAALTVTGAQRGYLLLRDGEHLKVSVARDHKGKPLPLDSLQVPSEVLENALSERRDLLSMNFGEQTPHKPGLSTSQLPVRSMICVPLVKITAAPTGNAEETMMLRQTANTVGILYMESRVGTAELTSGDRELLQTLAVEASTIIENARLLEQERLRIKLDDELNIAREIQQSLMPRHLPSTGWFRAAAASIPSLQVGGDYYDLRQLGSDTWAFVVADVSGKGVSSAILASLLQGAFLAGGLAAMRLDHLMSHVNHFLTERTGGEKYATLFCGVMSIDGLLRWSNAGHCAPILLRRSGEMVRLEASSLPLGMLEEATYTIERTQLQPGDKVIVYTDGVSEAANAMGRFFDAKRIESVARNCAAGSCKEMIDNLFSAVDAFTEDTPQGDDVTAVVVEYSPPAS
ncbi:MAG: SpoIIE family protein phosphatase [Candidatus Solibacter usitatus]|nr:SpoIIE family protein phosphatase [Candidatus Solibacter usitatus]